MTCPILFVGMSLVVLGCSAIRVNDRCARTSYQREWFLDIPCLYGQRYSGYGRGLLVHSGKKAAKMSR